MFPCLQSREDFITIASKTKRPVSNIQIEVSTVGKHIYGLMGKKEKKVWTWPKSKHIICQTWGWFCEHVWLPMQWHTVQLLLNPSILGTYSLESWDLTLALALLDFKLNGLTHRAWRTKNVQTFTVLHVGVTVHVHECSMFTVYSV